MIFDYLHYESTKELRPATTWVWALGTDGRSNWIATDGEYLNRVEWFGSADDLSDAIPQLRELPIATPLEELPGEGLAVYATAAGPRRQSTKLDADAEAEFVWWVAELKTSWDGGDGLSAGALDALVLEARELMGLPSKYAPDDQFPHFHMEV